MLFLLETLPFHISCFLKECQLKHHCLTYIQSETGRDQFCPEMFRKLSLRQKSYRIVVPKLSIIITLSFETFLMSISEIQD